MINVIIPPIPVETQELSLCKGILTYICAFFKVWLPAVRLVASNCNVFHSIPFMTAGTCHFDDVIMPRNIRHSERRRLNDRKWLAFLTCATKSVFDVPLVV